MADHIASSQPKVAIIVVCWNNESLLEECFESIAKLTYKNHVTFMADNASSDNSVNFTNKEFPWVHVVQTGSNRGFAAANNIAIDHAVEQFDDLDYFVFLNTDARLAANWLDVVVSYASLKPKGALFQSTTLDYYNHSIVDSTHIYVSQNGSGTQASWRSIYSGDRGPRKVFGTNAAAAMVSHRFLKAQPFNYVFDEMMFMYLEDVDLSARATVMGWDNYLVPGTFAYHMGSATSGRTPGFSLYMTYRNNIAMLAKNIPMSMLIRMVPGIIRSDYSTIKHLRRIDQSSAVPKLIKGRIAGFFRLSLFLPGIIKMHRYRKTVCKEYLWQLMHHGE